MKTHIFAGGLDATFKARILPLAEVLQKYNIECKVIPPIAWHSIAKSKLGNVLSVVLTHPLEEYISVLSGSPDVAIVGRISTPQMYLLLRFLKRKGVKIIFDLDDALFLRTGKIFGLTVRPGSFFLEKIVKYSDAVTVNGHYLLEYVRCFNKNVALIHDPIDTEFFSPKTRNNCGNVTIGWEGVPCHHYENLGLLKEPLMKLAKKYDVRFKIVSYLGDSRVKKMFSELEELMDIDYGSKRWVSMNKLPELLSDFDIMVAPLQKTSWYEGKSALRVGLGMAMGIPVVASPVGEQKYIVKHGVNGFLAKNEEEWYHYLKLLIEDDKLRREIGQKGRETADKELSLDICGKKLFSILEALSN